VFAEAEVVPPRIAVLEAVRVSGPVLAVGELPYYTMGKEEARSR
jgi:hypothetical protein